MRPYAALLALALSVTAAGAQDEPPPIWFVSPSALEPALGEVTVEVDVQAEGVRAVLFLVDGREAGRLEAPPYRLLVPLGEDFGSHRFEVVLLGADGELARAVRETPGLRVDEVVDLGLQQLYVALDGDRPPRPLTVEDFEIRDNGQRQEIVTFEGGDAALTVALLVDASDSMRGGALAAALGGARALLDGMRELDEASLILFADSILYRGSYSQDPSAVEAPLATVRAAGGTALNDALYIALRQLEERQGRRVVVLLSDGLDLHSVLGIEQVLWTLRRCRSVIYWIELRSLRSGDRIQSPWRTSAEHDAERAGLRGLVRESGGRVVPIADVGQAAEAFAEILGDLRSQYVLGYYPTQDLDDGAWHDVSVRVRERALKARTRGGYVDY